MVLMVFSVFHSFSFCLVMAFPFGFFLVSLTFPLAFSVVFPGFS